MNNAALFTNKKEIENRINEYKRKMKDDDYIPKAISTIKLRRDKIFAHNDRKFFVNPEKDDSYLPTYQLWFLRNFTGEVIHFLMDAYRILLTRATEEMILVIPQTDDGIFDDTYNFFKDMGIREF